MKLTNSEVEQLDQIAEIATFLASEPGIRAGIEIVRTQMRLINTLGGKRGVTIVGVITNPSATVVVPRGTPGISEIVDVFKELLTDVLDFDSLFDTLKGTGGDLKDFLKLNALLHGIPVGELADKIKDLFDSGDRHTVGAIHANRTVAGPWEKFALIPVSYHHDQRFLNTKPEIIVAILTHTGYLAAEDDGSAYANRRELGGYEKWRLILNDDGTVSFQSNKSNVGGIFVAQMEHVADRVCRADRTQIGPWEKFFLEFHSNGLVSIKTFLKHESKHQYLSAQP